MLYVYFSKGKNKYFILLKSIKSAKIIRSFFQLSAISSSG